MNKAAACPIPSCKAPPREPCVDDKGEPATWVHLHRAAASIELELANPCECFRTSYKEPHAGFCPARIWS